MKNKIMISICIAFSAYATLWWVPVKYYEHEVGNFVEYNLCGGLTIMSNIVGVKASRAYAIMEVKKSAEKAPKTPIVLWKTEAVINKINDCF